MVDMEGEARPRVRRKINLERRAQIGQERRARTRTQILEAAFVLLGRERGLTTRVEEICECAKISNGTFYNHFDSLGDLYEALSYDLNHDFNTAVNAFLNELPSAAERVGTAVRLYLERAVHDSRWAWAMVNISVGGPIFGADTHASAQRTAEEGIASGEFELTGPESGRDLQLGAGLAGMITQLKGPPSPAYATSVTRHILRGMGVPKDRVEQIIAQPLPEISFRRVL